MRLTLSSEGRLGLVISLVIVTFSVFTLKRETKHDFENKNHSFSVSNLDTFMIIYIVYIYAKSVATHTHNEHMYKHVYRH